MGFRSLFGVQGVCGLGFKLVYGTGIKAKVSTTYTKPKTQNPATYIDPEGPGSKNLTTSDFGDLAERDASRVVTHIATLFCGPLHKTKPLLQKAYCSDHYSS